MTVLTDLVEPLKREVAVPGTFSATYPTTSDSDLVGALADAFAAAQIDGFFLHQSADPVTGVVTPELSAAGGALVVAYAGERMISATLLNMRSRVAYEAGSVKYEVQTSTMVLVQLLKGLAERRRRLQTMGDSSGTSFYMADMFMDRAFPWSSLAVASEDPALVMYAYEVAGR